ncbi:MAG: ABC transporter ATP-binding protein [Clostridia bacterium]|nr:ABC transporter ATP-binding protein [Clostridia bacterium]
MKRILEYCKPYGLYLFFTLLIKTLGTVMDLVIPYLLGYILDWVAPRCTPENLAPIFYFGSLMILCAVVALVTNAAANRRTAFFAKSVIARLRSDCFRKILSLSARQTDVFTVPSLVSRMSSDTYSVHGMLNTVFRAGLRAPILFLGGIIITLSVEPVLSLSFLVMLPIMVLVVTFVSRHGIRLFKTKQKKVDKMVEKIRDTFTGIRVIKALSKVDYEKETFEKINRDLSRSEKTAHYVIAVSNPVISMCLNLGTAAVILLGAYRVFYGYTSPGQILSFMTYFTIILNSALTLTRIFSVCSRGIASADRINEVFLEREDLKIFSAGEPEAEAPYLEFRDVSFSYNKKTPTLQNVSFTLQKGQTLGIIGGTGCGKTTLIQLLLRFYDPDKGMILLEGRDLRSYPKKELNRRFGVVFQNDFLMASPLRDNVDFCRELSEEQMQRAAESAQASEFIGRLQEGMDHTLTTKGANLSGGQRQRVLLARALAGEPEILVLDDSSSALDYKTDAALREAIRKNHKNSTSVIVAQRISSIRHADLILVLEKGKLIGKGSDAYLAETCSVYREIAQSQMGEVAV